MPSRQWRGTRLGRSHAQAGVGLEAICALDGKAKAQLTETAQKTAMLARGWTRVLRLARTIADLEQSDPVLRRHVAEAFIYRRTATLNTPAPAAPVPNFKALEGS